MNKQIVFCTFRQSGFHKWPKAPDVCRFLRSLHRHDFHVRVEMIVSHANREVEFIQLKEVSQYEFKNIGYVNRTIDSMVDFGTRSCEQLAIDLKLAIEKDSPFIVSAIEVSEDGENGARVEF